MLLFGRPYPARALVESRILIQWTWGHRHWGGGLCSLTLSLSRKGLPADLHFAPSSKKVSFTGAQSIPLVLGTSLIEGSIATAARSARANALNAASHMWWSFRPVTVMWAVIPAFVQRL